MRIIVSVLTHLQFVCNTLFIPELKEFEDGLALLIENIKFRKFDNEFQKLLRNDLNKIKREKSYLYRQTKQVITTSSAVNSAKAR